MASRVDRNRMFSERIHSTPAIFKETFKLFGPQGCSDQMTKTELIFPAFSLTFVGFPVQFCFRCKFSSHEKLFESSLTVAWFFLTNHNSLLRHGNQWDFFILYRQQLTSNGFFSCLPKWAKAGFRVIEKDFEIKGWSCMFFLLYKTNRFYVAVRLFSK